MIETVFTKFAILIGKYLLNQDSLEDLEPIKYFLNFLKKETLANNAQEKLGITTLRKNTKKEEMIALIAETVDRQQLFALFQNNAVAFGLHPTQLEEILGCSKTERKRWTEEERLPVLCYEDFKYGSYPVYDLLGTIALLDQISCWREEHENNKAQRRKQAAKAAQETRRKRKEEREEKLEDLQKAKQRWGKFAEEFALAYWAVIAEQLSQFYQEKTGRAKTKGEEYRVVAKELDDLKVSAIALLATSPITSLNFCFHSDYPPDVVWHQQGWTAYFEANPGKHQFRGFYVCQLQVSEIPEKALFLIKSEQRDRYSFPCCEDLEPIDIENPQVNATFWRDETPINEGTLFTPQQVKQEINRCFASQMRQKIEENREQKFLELSQAAQAYRAEVIEEQRSTVSLFRKHFHQRLQARKTYWLTHFPQLTTYLELAEFTRWASRAAKTLQDNHLFQLAEKFYHIKTRAIAILNTCPLAKLTFYRPEYPDAGYYDYYRDCFVTEVKDYYSLFSTEIILPGSPDPEDCFQFHTPYPIGKNVFPLPEQLEQVTHLEQEGRFRFGHPLTPLELLIFNPQQIEDKLLKLIQEFNAEEIEKRRQERFSQIAEETQQKKQRIRELQQMEVFLIEGEESELIPYFYQMAKEQGLSKSKAIKWIKNQLKSLATCSQQLQNYPEFSSKYFHQACNKRWSNRNLKDKIGKMVK